MVVPFFEHCIRFGILQNQVGLIHKNVVQSVDGYEWGKKGRVK